MIFPGFPSPILTVLAASGAILLIGTLLPRPPDAFRGFLGADGSGGHMPALDMYRGILALVVALSHSMAFPLFRDDVIVGQLLSLDGRKAVAFFCVISGFVIFRSCANLGASQEALRHYAIRRALRILPVLILALLLSLLVTRDVDWALIASEMSLIGIFGLDSVTTANPTLWSIYPEILFYGLAPVIVALSGRSPIAFFVIAASVLAVGDRWTESFGIHVWKYFMIGMAISALDRSFGHLMNRRLRIAAMLLGVSLIGSDLYLGDVIGALFRSAFDQAWIAPDRQNTAAVFSVAIGFGCALTVIGSVRSGTVNAVARLLVLRWLGAISYPLFALHEVVYMFAFGWHFQAPRSFEGGEPAWNPGSAVLALTTILLAAAALATLVHILIERPFIRLGRRMSEPQRGLSAQNLPAVPVSAHP